MKLADEAIDKVNEITIQSVEAKKQADERAKTRDRIILTIVSIIQFLGIALTIANRGNVSLVLLIMVVTNSLSQMGIDFFTGKSKPFFSAAFRAVPVFVVVSAYYLTPHIV
jgi:hypothetical protein